jgi:two-component system phosphate regulon sensor histidine kinase PhoR
VTSRHRRLVVVATVALAGTVIVGVSATALILSAARERLVERLRAEASLLADGARDLGQDPPQAYARRAAESLGIRVTLIARDGTVIGDSAMDPENLGLLDNHLNRPEIRAARTRGSGESVRASVTTRLEYLYAAHLVPGDGPVKYVRLAMPLRRNAQSHTRYAWLIVALVFGSMLLLAGIANRAVWRLSRSVEWMTEAVERVARGEGREALTIPRGAELSPLARAVQKLQDVQAEKIEELDAERAVLSSVVSGMREGLLLVGSDLRVRLANESVCRTLGVSFDPTGHLLAEVVRHPTLIEDVETVLDHGDLVRESVVRFAGSGRAFRLHVTPLSRRADDSVSGALALLFDISRLESLERIRREFVANVSHELRTPLTSILAAVETLLDADVSDPDDARRFAEIIRRQSARMGALIDDLTDLSLIETGAVSLHRAPLDATEAIREVAEQLAREVDVRVEVSRPLTLRADRRRLEQMLTNLIENAIKFNRDGGSVRIHGGVEDGKPVIRVTDTGPGIAAEHQERVFHRFYRVDAGRSRALGGTGLGLSIVKHLMRLHDGTVRLDSELGKGSTFTLEFPEPAAESGEPEPTG